MSVGELMAFLEGYDKEMPVTIVVPEDYCSVMYGIESIKQVTHNAAMELGDKPWYVDTLEIRVRT